VKRLWLACFVLAAAWLTILVILTVVARFQDPLRSPQPSPNTHVFATEELDSLNVDGWLLMVILPAAFVAVSTACYVARRFSAKPS
jgi:hypothetical protein